MFEHQTFKNIINRLLVGAKKIANDEGVAIDTRETSIVNMALAPVAAEHAQLHIELDSLLDETYADTASRKFLIKRCSERGVHPYKATHAIRLGVFNVDVPIGARFTHDRIVFEAVEKIGAGTYKLRCETAGAVGNHGGGALVPVDYVEGLGAAKIADVITPGGDEEETERLRRRYFDSFAASAFGGNVQDYVEKISALDGVGGVKVHPVKYGGGTVGLTVIDSGYGAPTKSFLEELQQLVDPLPGKGMGIAPIDHKVTVDGVKNEILDIELYLTYQSGWSWESTRAAVEMAIDNIFFELSKGWDGVGWRDDENATLVVRVSHLETRILGVEGVLDVGGTKINGMAKNYELAADGIPKRGVVIA